MQIDKIKMSSRGQVVIPLDMRKDIKEGDKLIVIRKDDEIILKKLISETALWSEKSLAKTWMNKEEDDLIVCQITGKSYEKSVEIPIKKEDFQNGSLKVESYLRLDKIFSVEKSMVKYKVGSLKQTKFISIVNELCTYLKN